MTSRFIDQLALAWPFSRWERVPVVVAVSGGADSVALLRGLQQAAKGSDADFIVAHFDHQLRSDSSSDAEFVRELSEQLEVRCEIGQAEKDLASNQVGSIEQAARDARYDFLTSVAQQVGARYIATAHTADDQTETILHRVIRGTGLRGLGGIPASRELVKGITVVRPLLTIRRETVVQYLDELGQPYRTDLSNSDPQFTRNRIRNSLLPMLRSEFNEQVDESLRTLGQLASESSAYIESVAMKLYQQSVTVDTDIASIELRLLSGEAPVVVRAMLRHVWRTQKWSERDMAFRHWHELEDLVLAQGDELNATTINLPANIRATRQDSRVIIKNNGQH